MCDLLSVRVCAVGICLPQLVLCGNYASDGFLTLCGHFFALNQTRCAVMHTSFVPNLAGTTGFEPAISTLTGSHPRPLDDVPR